MSGLIRRGGGLALAVVLGAVAAWLVAAPIPMAKPAEMAAAAGAGLPCESSEIGNAILEVTGSEGQWKACEARLYGNEGRWSSYGELKTSVAAVMNACDPATKAATTRRMTQAIVEVSGAVPEGLLCAKQLYEMGNDDGCTSGCTDINWDVYKSEDEGGPTGASPGFGKVTVYGAVRKTLSICSHPWVTMAVMQNEGALPNRFVTAWPDGAVSGSQTRGQCNSHLYDNGDFQYGYERVRDLVRLRDQAPVCSNASIQAAFQALTGWNPRPFECNADRYTGGSWPNQAGLQNRVAASFRCRDPWIGQVKLLDFNTFPRGNGMSGECNIYLYGDGQWSSYQDLRTKMGVTKSVLDANGVSFTGSSGELRLDLNGQIIRFDPNDVQVGSLADGLISTGGGNLIATGGLNLIGGAGANLIATGGLNLKNLGGGSVIAAGNASLISDKGAGLISDKGAGLIGQAGGNIAATNGGY